MVCRFHVDKESSVVPIWVAFPRLPIHFFRQDALFAIATPIGNPLRLDASTLSLKRPSMARVQIEVDLLKHNPTKLGIGTSHESGFWQKLEYENLPPYCTHCNHVGHSETLCHVHNPGLKGVMKAADKGEAKPADKDEPNLFAGASNLPKVVNTISDSDNEFGKIAAEPLPNMVYSRPNSNGLSEVEQIPAEQPNLKPMVVPRIQNDQQRKTQQEQITMATLPAKEQSLPFGDKSHEQSDVSPATGSLIPEATAHGQKNLALDATVCGALDDTALNDTMDPAMGTSRDPELNKSSNMLVGSVLNLVEQPVLVGTEEDPNYIPQMNAIESSQPVCKKAPTDTPLVKSAAPHVDAMAQKNDFGSVDSPAQEDALTIINSEIDSAPTTFGLDVAVANTTLKLKNGAEIVIRSNETCYVDDLSTSKSPLQEANREASCSTLIDTNSTQEQIAVKENSTNSTQEQIAFKENSLIDIDVQEEEVDEEFIKVKSKNQGRGRGRGRRGRGRGRDRDWVVPESCWF